MNFGDFELCTLRLKILKQRDAITHFRKDTYIQQVTSLSNFFVSICSSRWAFVIFSFNIVMVFNRSRKFSSSKASTKAIIGGKRTSIMYKIVKRSSGIPNPNFKDKILTKIYKSIIGVSINPKISHLC